VANLWKVCYRLRLSTYGLARSRIPPNQVSNEGNTTMFHVFLDLVEGETYPTHDTFLGLKNIQDTFP